MRPKIVITLLLLAMIIIGATLFLKRDISKPQPPDDTAPATPEPTNQYIPPPVKKPAVATVETPALPAPESLPPSEPQISDEERQEQIGQRVQQLQDWSANDDDASLSNILDNLTNSEKEIRVAAVEAAKQFGSRDAIPALKAAAANTEDPHEKVALLDAADFLALPSISDLRAQQQSNSPTSSEPNPP